MSAATLQISLAPPDHRHARWLLPHQLAAWRGQFDEILLTIDYHRSAGRFADRWEEGRAAIGELARSVEGARVVEVDYGSAARQAVADAFFGGQPVPLKDFRGGPFYSYFFALQAAAHERVLHLDSDLFFGGGSPHWRREADALLDGSGDLLAAAPHPGPPAPDGRVVAPGAEPAGPARFRYRGLSTRVFYLSRSRFRERIGALRADPPPAWRDRMKARIEGNPCADLPEHLFSRAMAANGLFRIDFLGGEPGMWSLHPPYRAPAFYGQLPTLVRRVEQGELPAGQRGDHDINDSLVDWSEARAALRRNRWWRRWARRWPPGSGR